MRLLWGFSQAPNLSSATAVRCDVGTRGELREGAITNASIRGDVLSFLFEGPTGKLHLGRRSEGQVLLLRRVAGSEVPTLGEALEQATTLRDVAVSPVHGLLQRGGESYVASQYIDGVSLSEFLQRAAKPRWFGEVLRILHDALLVAERLDARRAVVGLGPSRYLFADTIWVTLQGKVVISEPVIAAYLLHVAPTSQTFKRAVTAREARALASDVEELAALLGKWHAQCFGSKRNAMETARSLLGSNLEHLSRHDLARQLADLSDQPVASPAQVAAAVQQLAGTELVRRRLLGAQTQAAASAASEKPSEPAVGSGTPKTGMGRSLGLPPPSPPPASLQSGARQRPGSAFAVPRPAPQSSAQDAWSGDTIYDASAMDDDDEVTAAFRPSQLPKLLAGGKPDVFERPTVPPPAAQSQDQLEQPRGEALSTQAEMGGGQAAEATETKTAPRGQLPEMPAAPAASSAALEVPSETLEAADASTEEQPVVLELKVRRAPSVPLPSAAPSASAAVEEAFPLKEPVSGPEASQAPAVGSEETPSLADDEHASASLASQEAFTSSGPAELDTPSDGDAVELASDDAAAALGSGAPKRRQGTYVVWGLVLVVALGAALLWALPRLP